MTRRVAVDPGSVDVDLLVAALGPRLVGADAVVTLLVPSAPRVTHEQVSWAPGEPLPGIDPEVAVRGHADLAVRRSVELLRDGEVDVVVSASPQAAALAASRFVLTRRTGVREPVVAVDVTTPAGPRSVMDVSGRVGISASTLVAAAGPVIADLAVDARIGWLAVGPSDREGRASIEALEGLLDRPVAAIGVADVLAGDADLVLTTGAAGRVLVDAVRELAPERVAHRWLAGLTSPVTLAEADPGAVSEAVGAEVTA